MLTLFLAILTTHLAVASVGVYLALKVVLRGR